MTDVPSARGSRARHPPVWARSAITDANSLLKWSHTDPMLSRISGADAWDAHELLCVAALPAERRGRVIVEVAGEVDQYTAPLLAACLQAQVGRLGIRELIVDMAGVRFLGGAGLSVLVAAQARCHGLGARLGVRCDGVRPVSRPLQLTGLCRLLCIDSGTGEGCRGGAESVWASVPPAPGRGTDLVAVGDEAVQLLPVTDGPRSSASSR